MIKLLQHRQGILGNGNLKMRSYRSYNSEQRAPFTLHKLNWHANNNMSNTCCLDCKYGFDHEMKNVIPHLLVHLLFKLSGENKISNIFLSKYM